MIGRTRAAAPNTNEKRFANMDVSLLFAVRRCCGLCVLAT